MRTIVDWVADLTPRRGHPKARQYGEVWRGQGGTVAEAISRAIRAMRDELTANNEIRIETLCKQCHDQAEERDDQVYLVVPYVE